MATLPRSGGSFTGEDAPPSGRLFARKGAIVFLGFFGLAEFEVGLADAGGFGGIHAGFEFGFFEEVAPAFVTVGRTLGLFEILHREFRFLLAADNPDDSGRIVGSDVMQNDRVRGAEFVACQRVPACGLGKRRLRITI